MATDRAQRSAGSEAPRDSGGAVLSEDVNDPPRLGDCPDFLTVEEARRVLRIGRGTAYELVRQWSESAGREGLEHRRFGNAIRIPRTALEKLLTPVDRLEPSLAPTGGFNKRRRNARRRRMLDGVA
jgi:excisionase family DNA binding protein